METDLSAQNVWIVFTNSVGYATAVASDDQRAGGNAVAVVQGTNAVTGIEQALSAARCR